MNALRDANVLILGLGASGLAMARWCARHGAQVRAWDSRLGTPAGAAMADALAAQAPGAVLHPGALDGAALDGIDRILRSPGLAPTDPRLAALHAAADAKGTAVQGELDLFAEALADLKAARGYAPQVLAVT